MQGTYLVYTPFHENSDDAGTIAWQALANAGIFLAVIAVMTGDTRGTGENSIKMHRDGEKYCVRAFAKLLKLNCHLCATAINL